MKKQSLEIKQKAQMSLFLSGLASVSCQMNSEQKPVLKYIPDVKIINPVFNVTLTSNDDKNEYLGYAEFSVDALFKEITERYINDRCNNEFSISGAITALELYKGLINTLNKEVDKLNTSIENYKQS